jgi:FdhD protein
VVVSRTSPTEMAIGLAEQLGITVVGYLQHDSFNLYTGGDHLLLDESLPPPT